MRLGDICDFINGGAWSDKEYVSSGLPVLKVSNCKTKGFQIEDINYLPLSSKEKYAKNKLRLGDVIIATVGSHPNLVESAAGRSCVVNEFVDGFYLNQNAVCLRTKDNNILDQTYLGYLCKERIFVNYIQNKGRGAANQMRIAIGAIKDFEFDLPDIEVQIQIAKILSAYDKLIENNQKQIKLLEEAAQRLYKEWFLDLCFPGYEDVEIINGIPEGWMFKPFSEIFEFVRGKSYSSKDLSETDGVLMVNLKNIKAYGGYNRGAEKRFIGKFKADQKLLPGDIVMGVTDMTQERRLVGHVALIPDLGEEVTFSMDLIKLNPISITKNYLYGTMQYGGYSNKISPLANGVNVLHLKPDSMMHFDMLIPSNNILAIFDSAFEPIRQRIELLQKQCVLASEARDRLLPKLMTGELEV
ncbi:restriction endonuclease subunit S [[Clostridium] hylemonae]|uniref:restriction endonuclease subunit S n=1 Tax=[Clostridium] hylemonae TaxID=89153 RepID=UPI001D069DC8|nr:restriction endonuclease subunit S [[Clostridium] hylemonae]MCB7521053.1 restriction endonuclease subunit S [[Clostridium] hylemonae]